MVIIIISLLVVTLTLVIILVIMAINNRQQKKVIKELEKISIYDDLTKIFNYRYLKIELLRIVKETRRKIAEEMKQNPEGAQRREIKPFSFIMIDFDGLKEINDTWGHPVGDAFLKVIANALTAIIRRAGDILARYAGDEFSVILPETGSLAAQEIAEKMRLKVENTKVKTEDGLKSTTISLGVITVTNFTGCENITAEEIIAAIIEKADSLLYQAKEAGRNKIVSAKATLKEVLA